MHYLWGPSVAPRLAPWAHETRPAWGPSAWRLRLGSRFRRHRPCSLSTPTSASPLPAAPQKRNSRGEPTIRGRGPPLWAAPSRSVPSSVARAGRVGCAAFLPPRASPLRPTRHGAATRDGARPRAPPAPAPAPYVEDVRGDAGPGGTSQRRPLPFRSKREWPRRPPPWPGRRLLALRRRAAANGHRGGGTAGGCQPPGHGSAETGAREPPPRPGPWGRSRGSWRRSREQQPEDHCSPRLRRTDAGPTLTPRAPDRQHDRRAAPGLLLHRAQG